jgi:hypothetical protein
VVEVVVLDEKGHFAVAAFLSGNLVGVAEVEAVKINCYSEVVAVVVAGAVVVVVAVRKQV